MPEEKQKQQAAVKRARDGVLLFLAEKGGELPMKEMHDYSEARFFIAHRGFSKLMEEYTEVGLVDFNHETGHTALTDDGYREVETIKVEKAKKKAERAAKRAARKEQQ